MTVPPAVITTVLGMKQLSVFSQPGVAEPGEFVTVADIPPSPCSANADGATAMSEKIDNNKKSEYDVFFNFYFFNYPYFNFMGMTNTFDV